MKVRLGYIFFQNTQLAFFVTSGTPYGTRCSKFQRVWKYACK